MSHPHADLRLQMAQKREYRRPGACRAGIPNLFAMRQAPAGGATARSRPAMGSTRRVRRGRSPRGCQGLERSIDNLLWKPAVGSPAGSARAMMRPTCVTFVDSPVEVGHL